MRKTEFVWIQVAGADPEPGEVIDIDGHKGVLTIGCPDPFWLDDPDKLVRVHHGPMARPGSVLTEDELVEARTKNIDSRRHGWRGAR